MFKKTALLSFMALMACSRLVLAQNAVEIKEIFPSLPPQPVADPTFKFGDCQFFARRPQSPAVKNLADGLILSCWIRNTENQIVQRSLHDMTDQGIYEYNRTVEPNDYIAGFAGGESVFYDYDAENYKARRMVAFDAKGETLWSYYFNEIQGKTVTPYEVTVRGTDDGYMIAYYDQRMPVKPIHGSDLMQYNTPEILVVLEKINFAGKLLSSKVVQVPIDLNTYVIVDKGGLQMWPMTEGKLTVMVESQYISEFITTHAYNTILIDKEDHTISSSSVFLTGTAGSGIKLRRVDSKGHLLLANYGGSSKEKWQAYAQTRMSLYDTDGLKLWSYDVIPDQPADGQAACLLWDINITPDGRYMILCEQRVTKNGQWVYNKEYDKLWAVILNEDGTLYQRFVILTGDDVRMLYTTQDDDEVPVTIETAFIHHKFYLAIHQATRSQQIYIPIGDWPKLMKLSKPPILRDFTGIRMYQISW